MATFFPAFSSKLCCIHRHKTGHLSSALGDMPNLCGLLEGKLSVERLWRPGSCEATRIESHALTEQSSDPLTFDFPADETQEPTVHMQTSTPPTSTRSSLLTLCTMSRTGAFFQLYGFTEEAFNFQFSNLGNGGAAVPLPLPHSATGSGYYEHNVRSDPRLDLRDVRKCDLWDLRDVARDHAQAGRPATARCPGGCGRSGGGFDAM
ncbi:hypothetical protein C8R43DRAFT_1132122 [Mycena crocata]|nr:hypothetical protein C8R43DRAFT_1132122 [Mycena crocata]